MAPAPTYADAAKGEEHSHHPSASECTPTPAVAGPPVLPATEDEHPRPAVVVPAAAPVVVQPPAAELPTPEELRTAYFAPAGYAGPDQPTVPFMAPDLRQRLGQASDDSEPPEVPPSPPAPSADLSA